MNISTQQAELDRLRDAGPYRIDRTAGERRISWPAVFAGGLLSVALMILLAMLGTGIGAGTLDPMTTDGSPSASAFGIGAGIWWTVSTLLAMFGGAYVAGRLSGVRLPTDGGLHGLLTWALALMTTVYLVGSGAGSLLSSAGGILGTVATVSATGAAAIAPKLAGIAGDQMQKAGISLESIKDEATTLLRQTGKPALQVGAVAQEAKSAADEVGNAVSSADPSRQDFSSLLERLLSQAKGTASQVDRDAVVNVVMARTGMTREEANRRVEGWQATAEQARARVAEATAAGRQKAREAADATARTVSRAMLLAFLAMAIGAVVAWFGGLLGQRPRPTRLAT